MTRRILEAHRKALHGTAAAFYSGEIIAEWGSVPITAEMIARFMESKDNGEVIYVAEASGKIAAFAEVVPSDNEQRAVYVDPDFGRLGLGAGYIVVRPDEHTLRSGRKMPCFFMEKNL